jgi:MFS family permease
MEPVPDEIGGIDREALQRRTLTTLRVSQVPGQAAVAGSVAVVSLLASDMLGSDRWAGIGGAAFTAGAAITAVPLAAAMRRRGRRPGLVVAFLVAAVGALVTAAGGQQRWFPLFVIGLVLFGAGQAATLQGRYVATDLVAPHQRARAVAAIVWIGTIGAVIGPVLTPAAKGLASSLGLVDLIGPYLVASALFLLSALIVWVRLRPDPLVVAGGTDPHAERARPLRQVRVSYGEIRRSRLAVLGLAAMAGSQAAMVAVMAMTPPHMKDHGHADLSALVIAVHIFGMFGLAPVVGRFVDRIGAVRAVGWGAVVLGSGTVSAVIAGYVPVLMFLGLFLLGLGWNIGLISGTTLLTSSVPDSARVAAQGTGDLTMSLCGAVAALGSGFVKASFGFHLLADAATVLAALLLVYSWRINVDLRRTSSLERGPQEVGGVADRVGSVGDHHRHPVEGVDLAVESPLGDIDSDRA